MSSGAPPLPPPRPASTTHPQPENFLLSTKGRDGILKATDFGLSRFFRDGEHLDEIVGSPFYVAPEVSASGGGASFKPPLCRPQAPACLVE